MYARPDPRMYGATMRQPALRVHHGLDPEQPMAGVEELHRFDQEAEQNPTVVSVLKDLFAIGPPSPAQEATSWDLDSDAPIAQPAQSGPGSIEPHATVENPYPLSSLDAVLPRSRLPVSGGSISSLPGGHLQGPVSSPEPPRAPRSDLARAQRGEPTEKGEWKRVEYALRRSRLGRIHERKRDANIADIVPETMEEWKRQKRWNAARRSIEARRRNAENHRVAIQLQNQNQLGFDMSHLPPGADGRGTVLGMPTIWTALPEGEHPFRPVAGWPFPQEFMEEGNERNTSHFGRFMPMLRDPCNGTVAWKMRPQMPQFVFDFVSPIPLPHSSHVVQLRLPDGTYIDDDSQFGRTAYNLEHPDNAEVRHQQQMLALGPPPPPMGEPFRTGVPPKFEIHTRSAIAANRDKRSLRALEYEQRAQTMGEMPLQPVDVGMGPMPLSRQHQQDLETRPFPSNAPTGHMPPSFQHEREFEARSVLGNAFMGPMSPPRRDQHQHGFEAHPDPRNPFMGSMLPPHQRQAEARPAPDDKFLGPTAPLRQHQAEVEGRLAPDEGSKMDPAIDRAAIEAMMAEESQEFWPYVLGNDSDPEQRGEMAQQPRNIGADPSMHVEATGEASIIHEGGRRPFVYNPSVETFVPAASRAAPPLSEVQKGKRAEVSSGDSAIDDPDTTEEDEGSDSDASQITVVPARPQASVVPGASSEDSGVPRPGRRTRRGKHKWKGKGKNKWKTQRGGFHGWPAR